MRQLYFVRHGESVDNAANVWSHTDTPLTELGRAQAVAIAEAIKKSELHFDLIVTSPLARAIETAQIIASVLNYPAYNIQANPQFVERDWGELTGLAKVYGPFSAQERALLNNRTVETVEALQQRAAKALALLQQVSEENVLLVGHSAFGRALWRVLHNQPPTLEYDPDTVALFNSHNIIPCIIAPPQDKKKWPRQK
ncbi:MAG TPA: histidine phosphatase family protein [Candidatus Saccharimonadales bacterium]|nr:histidine phosphatase family protein [Candidatus Saccharimonadales bacterium]